MSGNTKLGEIWNTSFPPVVSCPVDAPCYDGCYAQKAYRQYPGTRDAWTRNYRLYRANPNEYFRQINAFLSDVEPRYFRWQVAGDVVDVGHMSGILDAVYNHLKTTFCLFTKRYDILLDLLDTSTVAGEKLVLPKNLIILASGWPGHPMPDAIRDNYRVAWMQDSTETRIPKNAIWCEKSCIDCLSCYNPRVKRDVILPLH
jgi:hypothetical protein